MSIRMPPPRGLNQKETLESLDQWKTQCKNFYRRDDAFRPLFREHVTWNATEQNFGFQGQHAEERGENIETLLITIAGHLPFPYLTHKIVQDSRNWQDVFEIIYKHYGVQPTQATFLEYTKLRKKPDETPITFFERLLHHTRNHMAPANAEVDGQRNHQADQMNITIKNFVARDWIRLLHPDLTDIVATEYAVELRAGTQLAALVPRIAQNVDSLLKKSTALVNRIDTGKHENEREHESGVYWTKGGYQERGAMRGRGTRYNTSQQRPGGFRNSGTPYCPSCKYLAGQLKFEKLMKWDHKPADCPRKSAVRMLNAGDPVLDTLVQHDDLAEEQEWNTETQESPQ